MSAPRAASGTRPRRARPAPDHGDVRHIPDNKKGPKASQPNPKDTKGKGKKGKGKSAFNIEPLNPPFDPRMRRIGSPLNLTSQIKRGWVQTKEGDARVNFLFNPSELSLSHGVDLNMPTSEQTDASPDDAMDPVMASTMSTTGVKLLYDRTYEMFSPPKSGKIGFANKYGVWADVAAWYTLMGMIPEYPTSWEDSLITSPPQPKLAYLFIGPKMVYYGRIDSVGVTYSHWSQKMVPVRCAVDISFSILPFTGDVPFPGQGPIDVFGGGWLGDWLGNIQLNPDGTITSDPSPSVPPSVPPSGDSDDNDPWIDIVPGGLW